MSDPLVEEIVRQVLDEIRSRRVALRTEGSPTRDRGASRGAAAYSTSRASIRERVITAEILEDALRGDSTNGMRHITVAPDAILTPSARDWLRSREVECSRGAAAEARASQPAARLAVVIQSTAALHRALDDADPQGLHWKKEITDSPETAIRSVTAGIAGKELDETVVFTASPAAIACGVNRHREARAAVVDTAADMHRAAREMAANVFCVNPEAKSYFELRNLLRAIGAGEKTGTVPNWIS